MDSGMPGHPETERIAAVQRYQMVDAPAEGFFDRITRLTARLIETPLSAVTLVAADRVLIKSSWGLPVREIPREKQFCGAVVESGRPLVIPDTHLDPSCQGSILLNPEFGVRFYAGAPLTDQNGFHLGTLCVLDTQPRQFDADQLDNLEQLAQIMMDEIKLWQSNSELRLANEERFALQVQLAARKRFEALGMKVGTIAHDINNLIGPIITHAEILSQSDMDRHLEQMSHQIYQAGVQASRLCQRLLSFANHDVLFSEKVSIEVLLNEAIGLFRVQKPSRHVTIAISADLPQLDVDQTEIKQVLCNLLSNADEASPQGVPLEIVATRDSLDDQAIGAMALPNQAMPGRYIKFSVIDRGTGMSEEVKRSLFEPFVTTKRHGYGMGLPSVSNSLREYGSPLDVQSGVDAGTTMSFWWPLHAGRSRHEIELQSMPGRSADHPGSVGVILVVDDNRLVRQAIAAALKTLGVHAIVVASDIEAIEIFQQRHRDIDAVILDYWMPDADTLDTLVALQAIDPQVQVVVMSGDGKLPGIDGLVERGVVSWLRKPFAVDDLRRLLLPLIRGNQAAPSREPYDPLEPMEL